MVMFTPIVCFKLYIFQPLLKNMTAVEYMFAYSHHYLHYSLIAPTCRDVVSIVFPLLFLGSFLKEIFSEQVELWYLCDLMGRKDTDVGLTGHALLNIHFSGLQLCVMLLRVQPNSGFILNLCSITIPKSIFSNLNWSIYLRFLFFFLNELAFSDFFSQWCALSLKNQL